MNDMLKLILGLGAVFLLNACGDVEPDLSLDQNIGGNKEETEQEPGQKPDQKPDQINRIEPGQECVMDGISITQIGLTNARVTMKGISSLILTGKAGDAMTSSEVNLTEPDSWIFFPEVSRKEWNQSSLPGQIRIAGETLTDGTNGEVVNYYNGVMVRPVLPEKYSPALLYGTDPDSPKEVELYRIYKEGEIPVGDNLTNEIFLKRGFMAVIAENADGTGARNTYIAAKDNLRILLRNQPEYRGKVSFLRIVPWNYVCKRGIGATKNMHGDEKKEAAGITWFYDWGIKNPSTKSMNYVPMFHKKATQGMLDTVSVVYRAYTDHVLGFNEPDVKNQADFSVDHALSLYPVLLQAGVRTGTPSCGQSGMNKWLADFMTKAGQRGIHVDFVCVHWYDWDGWGKLQNKNPTPSQIQDIVDRFKAYLDACYARYHLPIWITEFNANRYRVQEAQAAFLKLAIPMLESHPHVERYAYFQPIGGNGYIPGGGPGGLSPVGQAYNCMPSTPAHP